MYQSGSQKLYYLHNVGCWKIDYRHSKAPANKTGLHAREIFLIDSQVKHKNTTRLFVLVLGYARDATARA